MPLLPGSAIFYKTKEQLARHHYYSMSSGGSWANDEATNNASESKAVLTKGQRGSAQSSLRYASYLDPSSSSLGSSLGRRDKTATKEIGSLIGPHWRSPC
jgi:hypothetical protein